MYFWQDEKLFQNAYRHKIIQIIKILNGKEFYISNLAPYMPLKDLIQEVNVSLHNTPKSLPPITVYYLPYSQEQYFNSVISYIQLHESMDETSHMTLKYEEQKWQWRP